jgi:Na+-driven multidrug efflux pump
MDTVNLSTNSMLLSSLGHQGAGSLTTTFQSLLLGIAGGALMSSGVALGKPIGESDFVTASEIAKASDALTLGLSAASIICYGGTYFAFPQLFSKDTADAASTYFLYSSIGNLPALALVTSGQLAFQSGDWVSPLLSSSVYRLSAVGLSYLLTKQLNMGVKGIGIGNAVAPWAGFLGLYFWMRQSRFQHLKQVGLSMTILKKHAKPLITLGSKMALQRVTEWGNLSILTSVLGAMNSKHLESINPSLQMMTLFNLFSQGIGLGGNMLLAVQRAKLKKMINTPIEDRPDDFIEDIKETQKNIKHTSIKCLTGGLLVNGVFAGCLFFAKKPIVNAFLPQDISSEAQDIAETALWVNGLGLVADALRIITSNLLNSYDRIMMPNIVSGILMTIVGISVGYGIHRAEGEGSDPIIPMFAFRTGMILLSAIINGIELRKLIKKDDEEISNVESSITHYMPPSNLNDLDVPSNSLRPTR